MNPNKSYKIDIYTDGSSLGNPGPGGYGIIMQIANNQYIREFSKGFRETTNNRMELLAVIVALENLKHPKQEITIYTDSRYVCDSVDKRWVFSWERKQFQGKKNADLWTRFLKVYRKHTVKWVWIKGHNQHLQNERCDFLATTAAKQKEGLAIDVAYETLKKENTLG